MIKLEQYKRTLETHSQKIYVRNNRKIMSLRGIKTNCGQKNISATHNILELSDHLLSDEAGDDRFVPLLLNSEGGPVAEWVRSLNFSALNHSIISPL